jgi:hypothetical protein
MVALEEVDDEEWVRQGTEICPPGVHGAVPVLIVSVQGTQAAEQIDVPNDPGFLAGFQFDALPPCVSLLAECDPATDGPANDQSKYLDNHPRSEEYGLRASIRRD